MKPAQKVTPEPGVHQSCGGPLGFNTDATRTGPGKSAGAFWFFHARFLQLKSDSLSFKIKPFLPEFPIRLSQTFILMWLKD